MTTNAVVLAVVAVVVAIVLVAVVAVTRHKLRGERRMFGGAGIIDEAVEDIRVTQQQEDNANGIEAFRSRGRRVESADSRETADMRDQLKDRGTHAD